MKKILVVALVAVLVLALTPAAVAVTPITIRGFRLQFRSDHPHAFYGCVSQPVAHFHVELFQSTGGGRYKYLSNFHVGSYHQATHKCFVVWNNHRPTMCMKTCGGQTGLRNILKSALIIVGVGIVTAGLLAATAAPALAAGLP